MMCCGKVICSGCIYTVQLRAYAAGRREDDVCPFCRTSSPSSNEESLNMFEKRTAMDDARAIYNLGCFYMKGKEGLPQNDAKAIELWHQAAEFGDADAYYSIGMSYKDGRGVEMNEKKAIHYLELAAMRGDVDARNNLGCIEIKTGNIDRALKHWMIAVKGGDSESLKNIKSLYLDGHATKDDYAIALRSYQAYVDDIKSDQRDEAVAFRGEHKYY